MSFWELYSWERVRDKIRSLPGRLGFAKGDRLNFFGLTLDLETGDIYDNVLEEHLTQKERVGMYFILSLYAETKTDVGESGELVSLSRQICPFVHCPNLKRNVAALEMIFGENPKLLYTVAKPFGYEPLDIGDAAVKVYALPRVPIILAVWAGEEGLPPSSEILFDKSAPHYLSGETSAVCEAALGLARALTGRLILRFARDLQVDISKIEFGGCGYTCAD
uniref:DUF3786 domain-containing protein n=1 Tax=Thermofilum pendens TaxID=2269 RepID=A0A7C1T2R1_THEPE